MTAPDRPEPICGPSCTPDCGMGHCYLTDGPYPDPEDAHNASEHANEHAANELPATPKLAADDLRQQLADAIRAADSWAQVGRPDDRERFADACAAVVQPVLDRQAAEITDLREQLRQARADLGRYDHYATQIGAKELDT